MHLTVHCKYDCACDKPILSRKVEKGGWDDGIDRERGMRRDKELVSV